MWSLKWILALVAILALASGCADVGRPVPGVGSPSPTITTAATQVGQEATLLARAVERLDQAKSYRFTIQAVHHWRTPEGQEYDWSFEGKGAVIPPNRFYSVMQGPADTLFEFKMLDGKLTNVDARGQLSQASTTFGGPGVGTGPYTVISYLRNSAAQGQVQTASLDGAETFRFSFSPNLDKVAATDVHHRSIQEKIKAVQGSVWVDAKTGRVSQEAVTVQSLDSRGLPQTVTITLKFFDYDAAVEIN